MLSIRFGLKFTFSGYLGMFHHRVKMLYYIPDLIVSSLLFFIIITLKITKAIWKASITALFRSIGCPPPGMNTIHNTIKTIVPPIPI